MTWLVQISAPHFVAGVVFTDQRITEAAPIVRYMLGWDSARMRRYIKSRLWSARTISAL